jgi:hypothetical protein
MNKTMSEVFLRQNFPYALWKDVIPEAWSRKTEGETDQD